MSDLDLVTETLDLCAETGADITEPVFKRFFTQSAESADVMGHSDQYMRGRMLEQTIALLLDADLEGDTPYLKWEMDNHRSYGVALSLYAPFFDAVRETIKEQLGEKWSAEHAKAWDQRIDKVIKAIGQASA